jgi:putative tricarboxylic transport membrane protein
MSDDTGTRLGRGEVWVGIGTVALALVLATQARLIPSEGIGSSVGPNVVPWFVSLALGVLGLALALEALFRKSEPASEPSSDAEERGAIDMRGAGWMVLGLFLNVALIENAGFMIASTLMFVCIARAFGSEQPLRDAGIAFALAFVAYFGFDRLLGYKIGTGLIERFI